MSTVRVKRVEVIAVQQQPQPDRIGAPVPQERAFVMATGDEIPQISFFLPVDQAPRINDEVEVDVRVRAALRPLQAVPLAGD